jgi:hypothetical protein
MLAIKAIGPITRIILIIYATARDGSIKKYNE